jgi:hypothetical protein
MEIEKDLKLSFIQAIDADTPLTKLWKYRSFILFYPFEAQALKGKMLDLALKSKLIGEYELINRYFSIPTSSIPREGLYGKLKDEIIPLINSIKV